MNKPTPVQQHILDMMQQGYVLSSTLSTKYVPFNMNPDHGGHLRHKNYYDTRADKTILASTIKAMLVKGLIAEESRYICSSGSWGEHETEEWCINYKLNLCAHCYEAPIAENGLYCQPCADKIGKEYMDEWTQRVGGGAA